MTTRRKKALTRTLPKNLSVSLSETIVKKEGKKRQKRQQQHDKGESVSTFINEWEQHEVREHHKQNTKETDSIFGLDQRRQQQQEEEEEKEKEKEKESPRLEPPIPLGELPIRSLEEYEVHRKKAKDAIFYERMRQLGRINEDSGAKLPSYTDVLRYVSQVESPEQALWFQASQKAIIGSKKLSFPTLPVLSRVYIAPFLQQPPRETAAAAASHNRPCVRPECVCETLYGFRMREIVMPDRLGRPTFSEDNAPGWCFICHLYYTNNLYWKRLQKIENRRSELCRELGKETLTEDEEPLGEAFIPVTHMFIVMVDHVGEYKLSKTLMGDTIPMGIYGPFPYFTVDNYTVYTLPDGRKALAESDTMVFRQSQTASQMIGASPLPTQQAGGRTSTRSSHTGSGALRLSDRR